MMMKRRLVITVLVAFLCGSLIFGALVNREATSRNSIHAQEADLTVVRVGASPYIAFAPVYLADLWGYFEEEGIDVEIVTNPGGDDLLTPLAKGDLDVVIGGFDAGQFNYAARNLDTDDDPGF